MSQEIQFRKIKLFTEDATQDFPTESIVDSVKTLFRGTDSYSTEYIEKFFEDISLKSLTISYGELEKIIPEFHKNSKYQIFDPTKITFLLIDRDLWNGIQEIVEKQLEDILKAKDWDTNSKLENIDTIMKDYSLLSSIFTKKLLCLNIF